MCAYYARRTSEDTDDLLQEAWVGMIEALSEVDIEVGCPEQYLIQRARWRVLDAIRRSQLRMKLPHEPLDGDFIDEKSFAVMFEQANVHAFLAQLSSLHHSIVVCLLEGMTWRETGSVHGCTSANIAYHVRRIRQSFEDWMSVDNCPSPPVPGRQPSLAV